MWQWVLVRRQSADSHQCVAGPGWRAGRCLYLIWAACTLLQRARWKWWLSDHDSHKVLYKCKTWPRMTGENQLPIILELRKECTDKTILINRRHKASNAAPSKLQWSAASLFHYVGCRKKMAFWSHIALVGGRLNFANLSVHWHQIQSIILFHFWSAIRKFYTLPACRWFVISKNLCPSSLSAILPSMFSQ